MKANLLWGVSLAFLLVGIALAEGSDVYMYGDGEIPDPAEIARMLGAESAPSSETETRGISLDSAPSPKMRGISLLPATAAPAPAPAAVQAPKVVQQRAQAKENKVIGVPVQFAVNSVEIQAKYKAPLDAVAKGIKSAGVRVIVEGHTDASGKASYNKRLSRRRAESVRQYMVSRHGINSDNLIVKGMGESALLDPRRPYAPENRRVQFRAVR
jgi:outer membrane protein OmpA-like peptidoglycan-associated protein